jgi:hypothetical protein
MAYGTIKASSCILVGGKHAFPKQNVRITAAAQAVAAAFGNDEEAGWYTAPLYGKGTLGDINRVYNAWYAGHRLRTIPFGGHGKNALAKVALPDWEEHWRKHSLLWEDEADKLANRLETEIIPAAKVRLAKLEDEVEVVWPSVEEFRGGFVFEKIVLPFPSNWVKLDDIRKDLNDGAVDAFTRIRDALNKSAKVLRSYGNVKRARLEEGPTQSDLADLVSAIKGFNIPDENGKLDPRLTELETEITSAILTPNLDDLKKDETLRSTAATKAQALADKVAGYV